MIHIHVRCKTYINKKTIYGYWDGKTNSLLYFYKICLKDENCKLKNVHWNFKNNEWQNMYRSMFVMIEKILSLVGDT